MSDSESLPKELYYLDSNFSIRSLRKYQIKDILLSHGINLPTSASKLDYIKRFSQDIEPRRNEIIEEHLLALKIREVEELKEEYGRGYRSHTRLQKSDSDETVFAVSEQKTRRRRNLTKGTNESLPKKDKDGFTIPLPKSRRRSTRRAGFDPPGFKMQDSFTSSDDENHITESSSNPGYNSHYSDNNNDGEEEEGDDDFVPHEPEEPDMEDELGEIEKEELEALYKDQSKSPESFARPKFYMMTRAQRADTLKEQSQLWKKRAMRLGYGLATIYFAIVFTGLCITAYARNKNGYCQNFPQPLKTNTTQFFNLPPSCIPCPDHGICSKGQLTCDALYERKTPFYNIGQVFPIADECIHNSILGKYVNRVERRIKDQLAKHQGEKACEYLISHPEMDISDPLPIARLKVKDVLHRLKIEVQNTLPKDKVDEIMMIALTSVLEDPKIHYTEIDNERYFGTENIKFSWICQLSRLYYATSLKMKLSILSSLAAIVILAFSVREYNNRQAYQYHINQLTKLVLNKLKEKSDIHRQTVALSPAVSVSELRSAIVDINNPSTLCDWNYVLEKIEINPHVRKSFQEERGEPVEYWELTT